MNRKYKLLNVFNILLILLLFLFDLRATTSSSGEFFPLSACEIKQKQKIVEFYNIGTKLDARIVTIPSCDTRNVLYAQDLVQGKMQNIVVVSGLYPVIIPEVLQDTDPKKKDPILVHGMSLPQILLDQDNFVRLAEYIETMNIYESAKRDLLSTTTGKVNQLDTRALGAATAYHQCISKLSDNFVNYRNAFIVYLDSLKAYVQYICTIRKVEDADSIAVIDNCKLQISQLTAEKVTQIKSIFDETLVGAVREYAHSETAFIYYCHIVQQKQLPDMFFTTRDMCHVCEDTLVKAARSPIIVVSTREHDDSWKRHTKGSNIKKVVIDTDVKFNTVFSSLTDKTKRDELISEYYKLCSPRGVSLLFQAPEIFAPLIPLFVISGEEFNLASGNVDKKIRRNQMAAYAMDSKLATLSMLIRMYQCVFSKMYMGIKADIIGETKAIITLPYFLHLNQAKLLEYLEYMMRQLQS